MISVYAVILCCYIHKNSNFSELIHLFRGVVCADAAISGLVLLLKVMCPVNKVTAGPGDAVVKCCQPMVLKINII